MSGAAYHLDRESIQLHEPVLLKCRFRADPELVLLCQSLGEQPHKGTPIGKMKNLYPFEALKRQAMDEAKMFVRHMRKQGFEPMQAESEMELWGPFAEKVDMSKGASLENFEAGNHLIPQGMYRTRAHGAWKPDGKGPRRLTKQMLDEPRYGKGASFYIRGRFLASHGKEEEATGTLIVGG